MKMKHKWYQIFIGFLAVFCLFSSASSAFVMDGGDEFNNGELQNKETDEENYVTFDYNDQQTLSYRYYISGSGENLDTSVVESLKPDTTGTSHTFIGWSTTRTGVTTEGTSAIVDFSSTTFHGGETLYAKYYASGDYTFKATQDADMSIKPSSSSVLRLNVKNFLVPCSKKFVDKLPSGRRQEPVICFTRRGAGFAALWSAAASPCPWRSLSSQC